MKSYNKRILVAFVSLLLATLLTTAIVSSVYAGYLTSDSASITAQVHNPQIHISLTGGSSGNVAVPGKDIILQNPTTVSLEKDTTPCYVFIKIEKTAGFDTFMYFVLDGWTKVGGFDNVYYIKQETKVTSDDGVSFNVFKNNTIYVDESIPEYQYDSFGTQSLTVTAYAVDITDQTPTAAAAWKTYINQ